MWYWLDGLINSRLIEQSLLSTIHVLGFFLGILIGLAAFAKIRNRFNWILVVFIGAVCTKALITIFEWLEFYNWEMMQSSPLFIEFCVIFLTLNMGLIFYFVNKNKKINRKHRKTFWNKLFKKDREARPRETILHPVSFIKTNKKTLRRTCPIHTR